MSEVQQVIYPELPSDGFYDLVDQVYDKLPYHVEDADKNYILTLVKEQCIDHNIHFYWMEGKARILGIYPKDSQTCYFGFWEGVDEEESHQTLFAHAHQQAKQLGFTSCEGPYHFNTFLRYRIRHQTPTWQQFSREPVNPSYYQSLLLKVGYQLKTKFESRLIRSSSVQDFYMDKSTFIETVKSIPFDFHVVDVAFWTKRADDLYTLINETFGDNPGFKILSFSAFSKLYNPQYASKLCASSSVVFEDKKTKKLASICLAHPNKASVSKGQNSDSKTQTNSSSPKTLLIKSVGVHPAFRRNNLMTFMGAYVMLSFKEKYEECIFCLMREDNHSLKFSDGLPYDSCEYGLYQKEL
ncbi:MAG: hypothetical protein OCD76_01465 [Reichenbachiella sp.]